MKTNFVKIKIDKMQQNSWCRLCNDREEQINHIISEWSKSVQKKYKTRHTWVGKVIYWELCKTFQLDILNKWCMHNPEYVLENETDAQKEKKKKKKREPADHRVKLKESGKRDKNLDLAREMENYATWK